MRRSATGAGPGDAGEDTVGLDAVDSRPTCGKCGSRLDRVPGTRRYRCDTCLDTYLPGSRHVKGR